MKDITRQDFFNVTGYFYGDDLLATKPWRYFSKLSAVPSDLANLTSPVDAYVKSFYSMIMIDMGSNSSTLATDPNTLQLYTQDFHNITSLGMFGPFTSDKYPKYVVGSNQETKELLQVKPSTIYTQYI
ncbi:hypothetical protein I5L01_15420, partial [Erythrobacter sp. YJ-T3-07]|uniref:hypothetical protein n=1 Tax=Erythrobacter sp. YJ-T3-07 TaxID=2793063 RepID=UPI0018D2B013